MNNILAFDLFIFDFDGTLMDTEKYHCKAWNLVLSEYKSSFQLNMLYYFKYFHIGNRGRKSLTINLKIHHKIINSTPLRFLYRGRFYLNKREAHR